MREYLDVEMTPFGQLLHHLYRAAYRYHRLVALTLYALVTACAYALAFLLRFELTWPSEYSAVFGTTLAVLLGVRVTAALVFPLTTGRWRFVSARDVLRLVFATATGTVVFFALAWSLPLEPRVPRSVILLEWVLTTFLTSGLWLAYRLTYEVLRHQRAEIDGSARRVLIVGAGEAGNLLAREIARMPSGLRPVGFVDDDPTRRGMRLQGLPVHGTTRDLERVVVEEAADEVIIAVPSASPAELRRIVRLCEAGGRPFRVLPGIAEVLAGDVRVSQVREVRIEDLLGREPIRMTLPELATDLAGSSVLITGAAGSIGSELARQVALHGPATLVLFDQAETDLFYLDLELRDRHHGLHIVPVIGDITDASAIERVFHRFRPDRVFHAAAYKHVPMMQINPLEAIRNNVIGTWRVADAAGRHGALKFVLVSSDKAVRPVSVMGATKRFGELVVLEVQEQYRDTTYAAVRFGNVLGSAGSVIPIFRKQLAEGKPLTVTHPEATRYFMTIPEAVQLILQASLLPEVGGRIAMFEMGEPVRIVDLARNLLELSGVRNPGAHIQYTGLRPGERLHEELVAPNEETNQTAVPKVRIVRTANGHAESVLPLVEQWNEALGNGGGDRVVAELTRWFGLGTSGAMFPGAASEHAVSEERSH